MPVTYDSAFDARLDTQAYAIDTIQDFQDLFSNAGWVRTGDTGQLNAADAVAITTTYTSAGYQVWRTNDGLTPIYLKIAFATGFSSTRLSLTITVSYGTDGAGNITDTIASISLANTSNANAGTGTFYGSGDPGRIVFFCGDSLTSNSTCSKLFSLERIYDVDGTKLESGVLIAAHARGGTGTADRSPVLVAFKAFTLDVPQPASSSVMGAYCPSGSSWAKDGGDVGVCPVHFFAGRLIPSKNLLCYMNSDFSPGASVPVANYYGEATNWMPLGSSVFNTIAPGNASSSMMLRWD